MSGILRGSSSCSQLESHVSVHILLGLGADTGAENGQMKSRNLTLLKWPSKSSPLFFSGGFLERAGDSVDDMRARFSSGGLQCACMASSVPESGGDSVPVLCENEVGMWNLVGTDFFLRPRPVTACGHFAAPGRLHHAVSVHFGSVMHFAVL